MDGRVSLRSTGLETLRQRGHVEQAGVNTKDLFEALICCATRQDGFSYDEGDTLQFIVKFVNDSVLGFRDQKARDARDLNNLSEKWKREAVEVELRGMKVRFLRPDGAKRDYKVATRCF